jgi:hypothetical protein
MIKIDFPDDGLNRIMAEFEEEIEEDIQEIVELTAQAARLFITEAYKRDLYMEPLGAFGYPRNDGALLANSVELEIGQLQAELFPTREEAAWVEFGTGIYSTDGPQEPIRPTGSKALAIPVYPQHSLDLENLFFIEAAKVEGLKEPLPDEAIGVVLAKSVKGMKPTPIWFTDEMMRRIEQVASEEARERGFQ